MVIKQLKKLMIFGILSILACATFCFLPSCSFHRPRLNEASDGVESWDIHHQFNVTCNWIGYYSEDVYAEVNAPANHLQDIECKQIKTIESLEIDFTIMSECPTINPSSFDIEINWFVKHTNIHKKTTEKIIPSIDNIIIFKRSYFYNNKPQQVPTSRQPIFSSGDAFECVNGYYNMLNYSNGQSFNKENIDTNINNDIIYYQYLCFETLKSICVSKSFLGGIYINLLPETWKMDLLCKYNLASQTFDYIQFHMTGDGDCLVFKDVATMSINYAWGNKQSETNENPVLQQFDKNISSNAISYHNFQIPDCPGPQLLGAYSMDNIPSHTPGNSNSPYNQNFLSLVPSDENSYQIYDVCIFVKNSAASIFLGKFIDSGWHIYFGRQPRMFGLEFITNERALSVHYPPANLNDVESFANLGLAIPSFSLTNASYDEENNDFVLPQTLSHIEQNKVDIDIIPPKIVDMPNGDCDNLDKHFFGSFAVGWSSHFFDDSTTDTTDNKYWKIGEGDFIYGLMGDKSSMYPIDPYDQNINYPNGKSQKDLFDIRLDWLRKNRDCIKTKDDTPDQTWDRISIIRSSEEGTPSINPIIEWWKVIQVDSMAYWLGDSNDKMTCYGGTIDMNPPLQWNDTYQFTKFVIGLNYMFSPSLENNLVVNADNCFTYSNLNDVVFQHNP